MLYGMANEELLSQTIRFLRFPLVVGVVFIHNKMGTINIQGTEINYTEWPWLTNIFYCFSNAIPAVCVPMFFFFSGFLFFYKTNLNKTIYIKKMKKRISSLLVPYLIFNFLGFLIFLTQMHLCFHKYFPLLSNYRVDIVTFLSSFWVTTIPKEMAGGSTPIDHPLWYLRDLLIMCSASPVIFYVIRKIGIVFVLVMGLFWFSQIGTLFGVPSIDHQALFFFPLGAYFSIRHLDFVQYARKKKWTMYAFVLCIVCDVVFKDNLCGIPFAMLGVLFGLFALPCFVSLLIQNNMISEYRSLSDASFFIYALHGLFISKYMKILILTLHPKSPYLVLLIYYFVPISTILICIVLYKLMKKWLPSVAIVITGGR